METRRALLVDAFTSEPLAGNAAGLVHSTDCVPAATADRTARSPPLMDRTVTCGSVNSNSPRRAITV